jgi:lipoprotein-anchoring transpeptidase ErfK/SrfK
MRESDWILPAMSDSPTPKPSRIRVIAVCAAVLVPVVPIIVALMLSGSGAPPVAAVSTTATSAYTPVTAAQKPPAHQHPAAARRTSVIPPGQGALIGYVSHAQAMHSSPGGRKFAEVQSKTDFGSPTIVYVKQVRQHGKWLGILSPHAGNGHIGWIRSTGVGLSRDTWSLHAVLSQHLLYVFHDGKLVNKFPIATGSPEAPTPTGEFAVTDRLNTGDPGGPYGCCILALSAKAPHHISDWDGGNRIAIHSTPETDSIGFSVSHGCMRLSLPDGQWLIDHVPDGSPVRISNAAAGLSSA